MVGVEDLEHRILFLQTDILSGQARSNEDAAATIADATGRLDASEETGGRILHLRHPAGTEARARLVVADRGLSGQSFMRAQAVVDLGPPGLELPIHGDQTGGIEVRPQFGFQGPVKAFDLALGLGMVRSAMSGANT
jgi:hypothetical protein